MSDLCVYYYMYLFYCVCILICGVYINLAFSLCCLYFLWVFREKVRASIMTII